MRTFRLVVSPVLSYRLVPRPRDAGVCVPLQHSSHGGHRGDPGRRGRTHGVPHALGLDPVVGERRKEGATAAQCAFRDTFKLATKINSRSVGQNPLNPYTYPNSNYGLIEQSTQEQLAEAARLLALNVAHYQMKYGEIALDDTLARVDSIEPSEKGMSVAFTTAAALGA